MTIIQKKLKMETEKKYRTAIGYLRVSTAEQGNGSSLETQKESIKNLCYNKNILLLDIYVDMFSGKDFERPNFKKAYDYIKENKADVDLFLTKRVDRYTRDTFTALEAQNKLNKLGVEVNFVDDWLDDINSPQGNMITTIKYAISTYERALILERSRIGTNHALRSGRYIKTPPQGYIMGKLPNGKAIIQQNKNAHLINELFIDYSTGLYSQIELVKKFNLKGLKISKTSISRILENVLYAGLIDLKKHNISPYYTITGLHEPIISEELFYKVQDIKDGKNRMIKKVRPKNSNFPLSAFMVCSCCGKAMYGSTSNNGKKKKNVREYSFYRCKNNCKEQSYKPEFVHEEFLKQLSKIKPSKGVSKLFEQILIDEYENHLKEQKGTLSSIENKINEIEKNQLSIVEKFGIGKIPEELYTKVMLKMTQELSELKLEKSKFGDYKKDLNKYVSFGLTIITNLDYFYDKAPIEVKTKLLGSYFNDKIVFEKNKFRTLPFNEILLLLCKYNKGYETFENKKGGFFLEASQSVLGTGLEPVRPLQSLDFKSSVSTNFTTQAVWIFF